MKKDKVEIIAILDRSGSMAPLVDDTIGGFNEFIQKQREASGTVNVSLYLFDDKYEEIYQDLPIDSVPELDANIYYARGMTALIDAVGKTINKVGERLKNTPEEERPEQVLFLITTDGAENSSQEFNTDQLKEMVKHQTDKYSWEFIFMGANIDSFSEAGGMGFNLSATSNYDPSSIGTRAVYSAMSSAVLKKRTDKNIVLNMVDEYNTAYDEVSNDG